MTDRDNPALLQTHGADTVLPLLEAVWGDGRLTDLEIAAICMAIVRHPHRGLTCREALGTWIDPGDPTTVEEIRVLRAQMSRSDAIPSTDGDAASE